MFSWLLGFGLIQTILKVLATIFDIVSPLFKALMEFIVWYMKTFFTGLGVIFNNLSTLTVLLVVIFTSGWYFKTWDNPKIIKECNQKIEAIKRNPPKVVKKPPTKETEIFNPFKWW